VQIAEQTERDIDVTRSQYIPVAVNTQILFFCVSDLSNIDPMYQYSLEWFISIFLNGIANADKSGIVASLIINKFFRTASKLTFSPDHFLITIMIIIRFVTRQVMVSRVLTVFGF